MTITLSRQQEQARKEVLSWYHDSNRSKPWFFLNGPGGVGKSSCTLAIVESIKGTILFAAPTGRAAHVMRQKGCEGAQTIHSLIYRPQGTGGNKAALEKMQKELATLVPGSDKHSQLAKQVQKLLEGFKPMFSLNLESPLREANLLVVDEISMVAKETMEDLLSFKVPILVLGDLWQLPPVGAKNFFKDIPPDYTLTEIHRQSLDNPIIQLCTRLRNKQPLVPGQYGESLVTRNKEDVNGLEYDVIVVGTHVMRIGTNNKIRRLLGYESEMPVVGDKVMCKRNDNKVGLVNGDEFEVTEFEDITSALGIIGIKNAEIDTRVTCHKEYFVGREKDIQPWDRMKAQEIVYSYARTCHSVQGGQFSKVLVKDESRKFPEPYRWLYTAVSRAVDKITVLI